MAEVRIGTPRQRTDISPEGKFFDYYEVEFFIDDARYTLAIPAKDYTAEVAEARVKEKAAEITAITGKTISL